MFDGLAAAKAGLAAATPQYVFVDPVHISVYGRGMKQVPIEKSCCCYSTIPRRQMAHRATIYMYMCVFLCMRHGLTFIVADGEGS